MGVAGDEAVACVCIGEAGSVAWTCPRRTGAQIEQRRIPRRLCLDMSHLRGRFGVCFLVMDEQVHGWY